MVASAVKLRHTSGRALYASAQLASIKLCDMAALFNCQLLSEVKKPIKSGYLRLFPVWQLYPFPNDNDATFKKNQDKNRGRPTQTDDGALNHEP